MKNRVNGILVAAIAVLLFTLALIYFATESYGTELQKRADACAAAADLWKVSAQQAFLGDAYAANDAALAAERLDCEVTR